jgi:rod shape-determining protein MreC
MIGQRERKIAARQRLITILVLVLAVLIAVIAPIRDRIVGFLAPILRIEHDVSANLQQKQDAKRSLDDATKEIDRLHALSNSLIFDRTEYERLKRENVELRQMVKYVAPDKFRTIPCGIIAYDVAGDRKLMTIDCGKDLGISHGNAVLTPDGILLGTIQGPNNGHSIVQLLKDPTSKIAAEVSGMNDAQGIVMPVGGGAVALRYLGENVHVEPATIIQTSGLLDQVPAGIPIGTIDTTVKESDTPFQRAIIQTPVDPASLKLVNVVISL